MIERLRESTFVQKMPHVHAHIFSFQKREMKFAVCWCRDSSVDVIFSQGVTRAESRDGKEIPVRENKLRVGPAPLYVYFQ
jgi:hypothetical protein